MMPSRGVVVQGLGLPQPPVPALVPIWALRMQYEPRSCVSRVYDATAMRLEPEHCGAFRILPSAPRRRCFAAGEN